MCFGNDEVNAQTMVNTFLINLANQIGRTGITKEVIANYTPAIVTNLYDGYYIYAPTYEPVTIESPLGLQLFLDNGNITTIPNDKIIYKAKTGGLNTSYEFYYSANTPAQTIDVEGYTTDITNAEMVYKHNLSKKIPYASTYNGTTVVNFTLDNRMYVYKTDNNGNAISRDGYLVYFDETNTNLPRIKITGSDITYITPINETKYGYESGTGNSIDIQSEILTEQILYTDDEATYTLGTFKYIYDIEHNKLYYDDGIQDTTDGTTGMFFRLNDNKTRSFYNSTSNPKYKSVSILVGDGRTTKYKKIYQALCGPDKGKWYMSSQEEDNTQHLFASKITPTYLDIELTNLADLGLNRKVGFGAIYRDFSAISYYVESYAFTNWVRENLGNVSSQQYVKFDENSNSYQIVSEVPIEGNQIFNVSATNNPEDDDSAFVQHKKRVMKELISESLDLAISNYNIGGRGDYTIPQITDRDWDHLFENISILSFVQGIPIGLKDYNNYTIATSQCNREYVNPDGIYLSGADLKYHLPYCKYSTSTRYTGYRNVEYILKSYSNETMNNEKKTILYYEHDERDNNNSELACYYCIVNPENYKQMENDGTEEMKEIIYYQVKAYNEALARERYSQRERVERTVALSINNMDIVFILDDSYSMRQNNHEARLVEVYTELIKSMTEESKNYSINTVYLNHTEEVIGSLTDKAERENYINTIKNTYRADIYATPYANGFNGAKTFLENLEDSSNKKVIVFFTDGEPSDEESVYKPIADDLKSTYNASIYAINFESTSYNSRSVLERIIDSENVLNATQEDLLDVFIKVIKKAR